MSLLFRHAQQTDLFELVTLLADDELGCTREDTTQPLNSRYQKAFEAIQNDPNNELIIAELDQHIAGMMQLTFIPYLTHTGSWRCLVEGVRIAKAYRGQGFGELMIKWAIQQAEKKQCHIVQLTSDKQRPEALNFYKKLGFIASHEGFKLKLKSCEKA